MVNKFQFKTFARYPRNRTLRADSQNSYFVHRALTHNANIHTWLTTLRGKVNYALNWRVVRVSGADLPRSADRHARVVQSETRLLLRAGPSRELEQLAARARLLYGPARMRTARKGLLCTLRHWAAIRGKQRTKEGDILDNL